MIGLSDVTRTSRVRSLTARELPLEVEGYLVYCTTLTNHTSYKYGTSYTGSFVITQYFTNGMVKLQCSPKKLGIIYVALSHTNRILKLNILVQKICLMMSTYDPQLYTFVLTIKACTQGI